MKNPWLSLWLSGANAIASRTRSIMTAEAHRAVNRATTDGIRQRRLIAGPSLRHRREDQESGRDFDAPG
jgi:hypothetical protein